MPLHLHRAGAHEMWSAARDNLTFRRVQALMGLCAPIAIAHPITRAMGRLDDLLYPEWREQPTTEPVFIYANPRSGTTLLHRLLSYDRDRFATITITDMLVLSVSWMRMWRGIGELDARTTGFGRKLLDRLNERTFTTWQDGIHEMGFDVPEEDEGTWVYCLHSVTFILLCPFLTRLPSLVWFDALDAPVRHRFLDYYEEVIRRLTYAKGAPQFLNKNVHFAPRVRSVHERFPHGAFVYLIRHPYQALPSFLSMWHEKWKTHSPEIGHDHPESVALAELAVAYLRYGLEAREFIAPDRFHLLRYDELVQDPRGVVEAIYAKYDWEMGDAFRVELGRATQRQRRHASSHEYSLEGFGLTPEWVYERLVDVFDEFEFEHGLSAEAERVARARFKVRRSRKHRVEGLPSAPSA